MSNTDRLINHNDAIQIASLLEDISEQYSQILTIPTLTTNKIEYDGETHSITEILTGYDPDRMIMTGDTEVDEKGNYSTSVQLKYVGDTWSDGTITIQTFNWKYGGAELVSWSSGTDDEIADMVDAYYSGDFSLEDVKSVWSVGDVRNVDLSAMAATGVGESHRAQTVQVQIIDFDHDTLTTSINGKTKALITVDLKNCLRDASVSDTQGSSNTEHGYMNATAVNNTGWAQSMRRTWCNNIFYNALPSTIKSKVKSVAKLTSIGNGSTTISAYSDKCFLVSEIEIFGTTTYSVSGEGTQYAHYTTASNRYKLPKWGSSNSSDAWWERSPYGSSVTDFCLFGPNGNTAAVDASNARGLAPAFCL